MGGMPEPEISAQEPAHDVLAAEAFAVPGPDPSLHQRPVVLPDDPSGIDEPHDVLAAEEFAMPAARSSRVADVLSRRAGSSSRLAVAMAAALLLGLLGLRLLRRP
jgi:hypothetical protein